MFVRVLHGVVTEGPVCFAAAAPPPGLAMARVAADELVLVCDGAGCVLAPLRRNHDGAATHVLRCIIQCANRELLARTYLITIAVSLLGSIC